MLKKLKGLFVIEDESTSNKDNSTSNKSTPVATKPSAAKEPTPISKTAKTPNPSTATNLDKKFVNKLLGAIEEHNIDGYDYLEFKQAILNLEKVAMDEPTKYKSAMAMAQSMKATKSGLIASAEHYLKVLKQEENKFNVAFQSQQKNKVTERNNKLKSLEDGITQRKNRIEELQVEIQKLEAQLKEAKGHANQANAKVQSTKENFYLAWNHVVGQIVEDMEKMKKYL